MLDSIRSPRGELETRIHKLEEGFVRQMRERGFDPTQAENIALPGPLAALYAELEELRAQLDEMEPDKEKGPN